MKKHVAIVAPIGSGKTTAAKFFEDKGFKLYKLSSAIYEEADKRGIDRKDRTSLQDLGDEMRAKGGLTVLADIAVKKAQENLEVGYVFDSIRNHNELKALRKAFGDDLLILAIDAHIKVRYKRVVERKGQYKEQETTFDQFLKINERDLGLGNEENEQNVAKCLDMAEETIDNSTTEKNFTNALEELYNLHFG